MNQIVNLTSNDMENEEGRANRPVLKRVKTTRSGTFSDGNKWKDPTILTFYKMHERCRDLADPYYGGRGIRVCPEWNTYEGFCADMGERPEGMTLDRIDGDKDYTPDNCRWATRAEQANNRSNNIRITHGGSDMTLAQWSRFLEIPYPTLYKKVVPTRGEDRSASVIQKNFEIFIEFLAKRAIKFDAKC